MRSEPLRVLLIESDPQSAALTRGHLASLLAEVEWVTCTAAATTALQSHATDVVLVGGLSPDDAPAHALASLQSVAPHVPVIVLAAPQDAQRAADSVREGAHEVLIKSSLSPQTLGCAIHCACARASMQREVHDYATELERENRAMEQFIRMMAHDLKTPLAVMHMELSWLLAGSETLSPKVEQSIRESLKTGVQLRRMIDDAQARARAGDALGAVEKVDCNNLFTEVLAQLDSAIAATRARVTADMLPMLWGNPQRLAQLFRNLLTLAIQEGREGQGEPCVHISAEFPDSDWLFSVNHNGCSLAKEDLERMFEPFAGRDGHGPATPRLSLALCKRIVQSHGGRIWVESEPAQGTTVYFTLPNRPAARSGA